MIYLYIGGSLYLLIGALMWLVPGLFGVSRELDGYLDVIRWPVRLLAKGI